MPTNKDFAKLTVQHHNGNTQWFVTFGESYQDFETDQERIAFVINTIRLGLTSGFTQHSNGYHRTRQIKTEIGVFIVIKPKIAEEKSSYEEVFTLQIVE